MELMITLISLLTGSIAGIIYGFSFMPHALNFTPLKKSNTQHANPRIFISFFLFSTLRILLIGTLLYYILHTGKLNIILVVLAFLISFWFIIIKKKAQ